MSTEKSQIRSQTLVFVIAAVAKSPTEARVPVRGLEFTADEPESLNGANAGPDSVECVLGVFAGCLNVMAHVIARGADLDVRDLEIATEDDLSPATSTSKRKDGRVGYQEICVAVTADADADVETIDA